MQRLSLRGLESPAGDTEAREGAANRLKLAGFLRLLLQPFPNSTADSCCVTNSNQSYCCVPRDLLCAAQTALIPRLLVGRGQEGTHDTWSATPSSHCNHPMLVLFGLVGLHPTLPHSQPSFRECGSLPGGSQDLKDCSPVGGGCACNPSIQLPQAC